VSGDLDWLDDGIRTQVVATCRAHGVNAPVYALDEIEPSEVIFIVGPVDETFPRAELRDALQALLDQALRPRWRKVGLGPYEAKYADRPLQRLDA
jgi:hypothetical protein